MCPAFRRLASLAARFVGLHRRVVTAMVEQSQNGMSVIRDFASSAKCGRMHD